MKLAFDPEGGFLNGKRLFNAAFNKRWEECKDIILTSPNLNYGFRSGYYGSTPFLVVCMRGNVEVAEMMLARMPPNIINATDAAGFSALDDAIEKDHNDLIKLLEDNGGKSFFYTKQANGEWK